MTISEIGSNEIDRLPDHLWLEHVKVKGLPIKIFELEKFYGSSDLFNFFSSHGSLRTLFQNRKLTQLIWLKLNDLPRIFSD